MALNDRGKEPACSADTLAEQWTPDGASVGAHAARELGDGESNHRPELEELSDDSDNDLVLEDEDGGDESEGDPYGVFIWRGRTLIVGSRSDRLIWI